MDRRWLEAAGVPARPGAGGRRSARGAACAGALALALALLGCSSGGSEAELVASAQALLDKHDTKGAVIQLKNALQRNPQSAPARLLLGKSLLAGGDPVAALVELRKAQELQAADEQVIPDLARAQLMVGEPAKVITQYGELTLREARAAADLKTTLAMAYAVQRDKEAARKATEDALRLLPAYAPALIVQARLTAAEGDFDGAMQVLDQVLASDAGNEQAGILKGEILWEGKGQTAAALEIFSRIAKAHPESIAAHAGVINIQLQQGKLDLARAEFAALKLAAPRHADTLYYEAQLAYIDQHYEAARDIANAILKLAPDNPRLLELAGAAAFRLQQYAQAEAFFGRALANSPRPVLTRQMLAQTHLRAGEPAKAIEVLQAVIESAKSDGTSLALAGEAYLQLGDAKRSEAAFQRALKAAPDDARVRTSAAMAQLARGSSGPALAELESIAAGDASPRADLALISARLRQSDLPGALKAIAALEKKQPDRPLAPNLRGRVQMLQHDAEAATRSFELALQKDPGYFPAVASLAALQLSQGQADAAHQRLEGFLKAHPGHIQALLGLAELEERTGAAPATVTSRLQSAVKLNPTERLPHLALINRYLSMGDAKSALGAAQDASAVLTGDLSILEALGRAQIAAGNGELAIASFKRLGSLQPRNPMHEVRLADAYLASRNKEGASAALRRALEIEPDMPLALRGQALIAVSDNRFQDGIAIARRMQARNPTSSAGHELEGELEFAAQHWPAAAAAYGAALQRNRSSDVAVHLHASLRRSGKTAEAQRLAADWQQAHPDDVGFLFYMGDIALADGDLPRAEAGYREVLKLQPSNGLALNNVAWLMVRQGKPGARALAEKAVAALPDRAPLLDTLSGALELENQLPQAIETQKRAITLAPDDPMLVMRLAHLYIKQGDKARARAELEALAKLGPRFPSQDEVARLLKTL
jgi:putative PEP-CTERM system TPR-repeat lipoprotein